jgi:hypothetical protein
MSQRYLENDAICASMFKLLPDEALVQVSTRILHV